MKALKPHVHRRINRLKFEALSKLKKMFIYLLIRKTIDSYISYVQYTA